MSGIVVTFGEIMGRIAAPENLRLRQARQFDMTYAGAEASVAASICNFGGRARYVTALPKHALAEATMDSIRSVGIDTQFVLRTDQGRLGLYFLETGANQRPSNVIYDREDSAIAITTADQYDWDGILAGAQWLHLSGITPALSSNAAEATRVAALKAKEAGATVSIDLNFRGKLWKWDPSKSARELAQTTMKGILPFVDVVIANEEDCHDVLGIQAGDTDVHSGALDTSRYPDVARQVVKQFPNVSQVAITLRESLSATHNNWGAMLYDAPSDKAAFAPLDADGKYQSYEIKNIVDRVGGGDSFAGGLIFAMMTPELSEPTTAVKYAVAASCLKHSIKGDFNYSTRAEVEALMGGSASGRVVR
ncbi:2-dehydro-3-deoxygluconokinase [Neorhodopirellula lusitana]|uniref:2-dehydro-3-deoxygluconokinase n=1 Tax=Neorhodopirellula lusitana TaxID=445327 RepID=A0ABY1PSE0_9BACT|nr:sugar kinase [Neorhodopirellula lusitana]SMP41393.1 2-dehydro-3-deoxygluconokinase [Neorhodopirellula lusitana]